MSKILSFLLLTMMHFIISGCHDDVVVPVRPTDVIVKVISPKMNTEHLNSEEILFEAELYINNKLEPFNSITWVSNISGPILKGNKLRKELEVGDHLVVCNIEKDNYVYSSEKIKVIVKNQTKIDTLWNSSDLEIFRFKDIPNYTINVDNNDNVLLGTKKGLLRYENNTWHQYLGVLPNPLVGIIAVDASNDIYIGYVFVNGISRLKEGRWETFDMDDSLGGDVHSITFDIDGNLWVATSYGNIIKYQSGNWIEFANQPIKFHHPHSLFFDDNQILWGGSEDGCFKFDGYNWELLQFNNGLLKSWALALGSDGTIWSLYQHKLYEISSTGTRIYTNTDCEYFGFDSYHLAVDLNNNLLIGSRNGIIKFNGTNFELLNLPMDDKAIYDIKVDSQNRIWFCTKNYFGVYKNH